MLLGGHDEDGRETVPGGVFAPQGGFLDRQVGQDAARAARRRQLGGEPLDAVAVDGVPVRHHQDRGPGGLVRLAHGAQRVGDLDAAAQGDVVGGLDDRAVQDRVAVRKADLDDVRAAREDGLDRLDGPVHGGEARREVGDEGRAVLGLRLGEGVAQQLDVAAHFDSPSPSYSPK
ncbi:hypothetical protein GCM10020254_61080 [Streptomyces goshikiensis]